MSISSPAAFPVADISIPPAVVVICKASAPVPVEDKIKLESVAPAKAIVKSSAAPSVVDVILILLVPLHVLKLLLYHLHFLELKV